MIVISSSLPKSASTLVHNYQIDMLNLVYQRTGQSQLYSVFGGGGFIPHFNPSTVMKLLVITFSYGPVVIKAHCAPSPLIKLLINLGLAKATYCYRDPRDVVLSVIDHGEKSRKGAIDPKPFAEYENVLQTIPMVQTYLNFLSSWKTFGKVHFIKYEDLHKNKLNELKKMAHYLQWEIHEDDLKHIIDKQERFKYTHSRFNKGVTQRYKNEMTESELLTCNNTFRDFLKQLDYEL